MIRLLPICLFFFLQVHAAKGLGPSAIKSLWASDTAVLYIFIGSDWCANCKRLEKNVLNDSAFLKTMSTHKVRIELIDFPQRKKLKKEIADYNKNIADRFGFKGTFPTLVISSGDFKTFRTFYYGNESALLFSDTILKEFKKINE